METASFSDVRKNLTEISERVARDCVEVTVFKRSKPLFKLVPVGSEPNVRQRTRADVSDTVQADNRSVSRGDDAESPDELFDRMLAMRECMPRGTALSTMDVAEMREELARRV